MLGMSVAQRQLDRMVQDIQTNLSRSLLDSLMNTLEPPGLRGKYYRQMWNVNRVTFKYNARKID